ncbi:glycoside hydrolase superfamily [Aspergillus karnatakaensis]|uniref:glycoside hydrolase superfamily n=1 Tax=Aspergillus karnatakaensis TaxID=1810916 RepID=UPI003CCE2879
MAAVVISKQNWASLIQEMTLQEKCSLLAGADFWHTAAIERLGIPSLKMSDGPNGARGESFVGGKSSACFPASVSLAASWDTALVNAIGGALAEDTKSKGAHVLLAPTVCPHRHPLGGRNFESFSEDPFLAGSLANQYIKGLQGNGIGAVIKHYAANEQETSRMKVDVQVSERALREIYLRPFEIAIKDAHSLAVMTAYNSVNGAHADMNEFLIKKVLREDWGFKGLVMSDWGGTNSTAASLNAGLDLEMPGPPIHRTFDAVQEALQSGETDTFKSPPRNGTEEQAVDLAEHRALIQQAGAESTVLLKNESNILPLHPQEYKSIALLGLAKEYLGHGGGSAAVNSHHKVTPFDAFSEALGGSCELKYAEGARITLFLPTISADVTTSEGQPGFDVRVTFTDATLPKLLVVPAASLHHVQEKNIHTAEMTGIYRPSESGAHYITLNLFGEATVTINGEVVLQANCSDDLMGNLLGASTAVHVQHDFVEGQKYEIKIYATSADCSDSGLTIIGDRFITFTLGMMHQAEYEADLISPAVEAARSSDIAIVFTGHTPSWETEGVDHASYALPKDGSQDRLVEAVATAKPNTIVVNSTGSPVSMPWASKVAAIVQAWFPGQEAGYSIVDVLLGKANPGGKLPVTFPRALDDCLADANFPGNVESRVVEYKEDVLVGYRHHDRHPEGVLFPFGFGLSYTTFTIDDASVRVSTQSVSGASKPFCVQVRVETTGPVRGSEVVQVYIQPPANTSVQRPLKELAGFGKIQLEAGEGGWVDIMIPLRAFAYWNSEKGI